MEKKTLGLGIICKNEVNDIYRIIKNYKKYFDKIVITVTSKEEWEALYKFNGMDNKVLVNYFEWCDDFAKARNFNFSHIDTDYIFWIDSDDEISDPEKLKDLVKDAQENDLDLIWLYYYYNPEEGVEHWKERLLRNNGVFYWKGKVHESLLSKENHKFKISYSDDIHINHLSTPERREESQKRNLEILFREYDKDGENTDPRIISYIGMTLYGLGMYRDSIKFFNLHIERSGWKEDIYNSYLCLARAYHYLKQLDVAVACCYEAMELRADFPDSYLLLAEIKFTQKKWKDVIAWTTIGMGKDIPKFGLPIMVKSNYTYRPLGFASYAYLQLGEIDKAFKTVGVAKKIAPNNKDVIKQFEFVNDIYAENEFLKNFLYIKSYLEDRDKDKIKYLPDIVPSNLAKDDRFIQIRNAIVKPYKWKDNEIAIFCGQAWEDWSDPSVISGIGGSEEAVVYASREMAKLGFKVTVFNSCGDMDGEFNGVTYKNFYEFNPRDIFNTLIVWRGSLFGTGEIKAKKKIVWLHDVPSVNHFSEDELKEIDKIIVLSKYHASLLGDSVPKEKILISTNGLNVKDFEALKDVKREPFRICYTSSYDRGLEHLLDRWEDIKQGCPEAELHIYYGWNTFDKICEGNKERMAWKESMVKKMEQDDIYEHGRVGQRRILKEMAKSHIFAYPCHFEEINCISVLKAQACGCFALTTNFGALKETNKYGIKINGNARDKKVLDSYIENLVYNLNQTHDEEKPKKILEEYNWSNIIRRWNEESIL